jgi:phosphatidylglycerophosphate synthase
MPETKKFAGDKKVGKSVLSNAENKLKYWLVPKVPEYIETYHLTMMTVVWSIGNVVLSFFVKNNHFVLWFVSLMILLQYLTDLLDGEVGRQRDTGLIKWGFYMDHFLDFIFLCSLVFVGYMISPKGLEAWYFGLLVITGGFMINSFLLFAATNDFEIYRYGLGPTEFRCGLILINTYIILFGTTKFYLLLPAMAIVTFIALVVNTYQIHRRLWTLDMEAKFKRK